VPDRLVLRPRSLVAFCWIAAVGCLAVFGAIALSGPGPDSGPIDYIGTAAFGIIASLVFLRATRVRVELDDRGITVFRVFTTEFLLWSDLADVSADYGGLRLVRNDGHVVTAGSMASRTGRRGFTEMWRPTNGWP
jgi:Bacterial PH domain